MANKLKIVVTVNLIPHPNPKVATDLIAEIVLEQLARGKEERDLARVVRKVG